MGVYTPRDKSYHRAYSFYEKLKLGHEQVISHLQRLENENNKTSEKLQEAQEEEMLLLLSAFQFTSCGVVVSAFVF